MSARLIGIVAAAIYFLGPGTDARASDVEEVAPLGEAVERHLGTDGPMQQWVQDPDRVAAEEGDTIETREVLVDALDTIKLSNLVPPIHFESGVANIPPSTIDSLADILDRMQDRLNVRLHLIGHADDRPLSPPLVEIYGDNAGLSRERAGQVAEYFQTALTLPPEAVSYDWAGDTQPVASNRSEEGRALNRRVEVEVWYDEPRAEVALEEFLVPHEISQVKVCRMETLCKLSYVDGHEQRARIQNLIAPLHFTDESIEVDEAFIERVQQALENLSDKQNVVVSFVGYTDDAPLAGRTERIYGDHTGLSKARARRVALAVQDALGLPTSMILSDGRGTVRPLGSNGTQRGRALNRRVEVEFWYDDPLQELPNEPQLCPEDAGALTVTRVYDPPWGSIADINFVDGQPVLPEGYTADLERALGDISDRANPRLRFVGYTRNERLQRRTAAVYGDDIGWSAARARRTMDAVAAELGLESDETEFEGRGYVHSDDVVNAGFVSGETSHVTVEAVYDELAVLDDYEGVEITRLTQELTPENPLGLNLMRITVDGEPIDDPKRSSSDVQRCTDVAFSGAGIQFGFDNLRSEPRLSVAAEPSNIYLTTAIRTNSLLLPNQFLIGLDASPVDFRMYTNYSHFIDRAEIRVFTEGQSLQSEPMAVVPIESNGLARWDPHAESIQAPVKELTYVLRAYGHDGDFDETTPLPLWVMYGSNDHVRDAQTQDEVPTRELLAAYGENSLDLHNIGLGSGTVNVRGSGVPEDHQVWVAGRRVPVDEYGSFVAEEVLPEGTHTVEVAILDEEGSGELYLRDLELETDDWFYVGMADVTLSSNSSSGPIDLLQGDNSDADYDSNVDGRLAFFVDGKFGDHWSLTAGADTREGPIEDLFSNFMDKSPEALFRRIDPDYYYPTFGDDSTVEELMPSMGRFYVRLGKDDNFGQWGNFRIGYMDNELARVDRGLYGANLHFQSATATDFGEQRYAIDAFAAEPGTIASREEFRGTGGSLYFMQRQDILAGSERVHIEIRDKVSGVVTAVVNLMPSMDYDIDYLQGRILLSEPLASTSPDNLIVRSGAASGDEAYLVVRYEYTPGFDSIDALSTGGQAHYWFGDRVRIGMTSNINEQDDVDSSLLGGSLTFRWSADSWLKVQQATSEGLVSLPVVSGDGGFGFTGFDPAGFVDAKADATRVDVSIDLADITNLSEGRLNFYTQDAEAGYSAPGLTALADTTIQGGALTLPIGERFSIDAKVDSRTQQQGIDISAQEFSVGYRFSSNWDMRAGYRLDERVDNSIIVPLTQEEGERADAVIQVGYDTRSDWSAYAFAQDTVSVSGNREENARFGIGGSYRISDKLHIDAEVSNGDLGTGGRVGTDYLHSERTSMYLNYALENERTDNAMRVLRGGQGSLVAGIRTRWSDTASVFLEERYQHSTTMTGLTHATGINFAPAQHWTMGFNTDIGTLQDLASGADTDRVAGGVTLGYGSGSLQFSSGFEYRSDDIEQLDLSRTERTTWLFRSNFKYQIDAGTRLLGRLNHAESDSSLGTFFDGGYTEAVLGYGFRPIDNDRLNALVKYTYFYNVPTTEQISLQSVASEFIQKTQIAAVDVTYDLSSNLTVGGKYAYRLAQISLDRETIDFFDNNASLYVLRGDYRFLDHYELLAEGRMLSLSDIDERRVGALIAVSRYLGDHLKIGAGYNFSDFSDDLTDLSYDHQGFFLSITGSM